MQLLPQGETTKRGLNGYFSTQPKGDSSAAFSALTVTMQNLQRFGYFSSGLLMLTLMHCYIHCWRSTRVGNLNAFTGTKTDSAINNARVCAINDDLRCGPAENIKGFR